MPIVRIGALLLATIPCGTARAESILREVGREGVVSEPSSPASGQASSPATEGNPAALEERLKRALPVYETLFGDAVRSAPRAGINLPAPAPDVFFQVFNASRETSGVRPAKSVVSVVRRYDVLDQGSMPEDSKNLMRQTFSCGRSDFEFMVAFPKAERLMRYSLQYSCDGRCLGFVQSAVINNDSSAPAVGGSAGPVSVDSSLCDALWSGRIGSDDRRGQKMEWN